MRNLARQGSSAGGGARGCPQLSEEAGGIDKAIPGSQALLRQEDQGDVLIWAITLVVFFMAPPFVRFQFFSFACKSFAFFSEKNKAKRFSGKQEESFVREREFRLSFQVGLKFYRQGIGCGGNEVRLWLRVGLQC